MKKISEKVVVVGFGSALLMLMGVGTASYLSIKRASDNKQWVEHTREVLENISKISDGLKDAQSGRRGYIITREDIFLRTYRRGYQTTQEALNAVRRLTIDNPRQQRRIDELEPLIAQRLALLQHISDRKQAEAALKQARDRLEIRVQERTKELTEANATLQVEIAERKEAERKLEQLMLDLQRSNQELEQFAYLASHDLQEPLRAVTGYTELLEQEYKQDLDETAKEYMGYIVDGATRMRQLIQDLLSYSRVGTRGKAFVPTDCNQALRQALNDLQVAIAEHNAIITYDRLPTAIADKAQLAQLFQNLIGNAIKFRRDEPPQIQIWAEAKDDLWLFGVRDNGIGIKPRYLERIFELFKRLHTRKEFPGTGIGLAICKKIVERHGGNIWAESQPGVGTTFYFTLPVRQLTVNS